MDVLKKKMPARKKEKLERLLGIANLDLPLFKSIGLSLLELYDTGVFRVSLSGPRTTAELTDPNIKLLRKKFNVDETTFEKIVGAFLHCLHFAIRKEESEMYEWLKENKDVETAEKLREKIIFANEVLKKDPRLKQGYLVYTFSKLYCFYDVEWETDMKVFQSPSTFLLTEETPLLFPSTRLRLILRATAISPVEPEVKSFEFEISAKDLDFLIKSLQDSREAFRNLEKKKLVDQ